MKNPIILQSSKDFYKINEYINANPSENVEKISDAEFKSYLRVYADYTALTNNGIPEVIVNEMLKRKITPQQFMH